jgi:GT2 family glycosyltransferase
MTDVSFIVVDINGGEMLQRCLASIEAQTVAPLEVVVHDNSAHNIGFAAGVNAAYAQSRGPFIALVNNDAVLDPDWLETVLRAMENDPKLAAVQTVIRRDESTIDGAGIDISDGTYRQRLHGCSVAGLLSNRAPQQPSPPPAVSATAALYRRAAIGDRFFDERFFAYYEDVDLCARLHEEGWSTRVLSVVKATHRGSASASILGKDALRLRTRNRYWVARRHRGVGRIGALLWEDVKLFIRKPAIARIRGVWEGLRT